MPLIETVIYVIYGVRSTRSITRTRTYKDQVNTRCTTPKRKNRKTRGRHVARSNLIRGKWQLVWGHPHIMTGLFPTLISALTILILTAYRPIHTLTVSHCCTSTSSEFDQTQRKCLAAPDHPDSSASLHCKPYHTASVINIRSTCWDEESRQVTMPMDEVDQTAWMISDMAVLDS